jgi:hypothetical protein
MSYNTINRCATDSTFQGRVSAACAAENEPDPVPAMYRIIWGVSAKSDIEAAYASAVAGGSANPGGDEAVVTDQMILSAVQAELAEGVQPT